MCIYNLLYSQKGRLNKAKHRLVLYNLFVLMKASFLATQSKDKKGRQLPIFPSNFFCLLLFVVYT